MDLAMAHLTEGEQVGESIFPPVLAVDQVMALQAAIPFAALLTGILIAHQTGDAQVLIQTSWVLVLCSMQDRIVQAGYVYLHILDHDMADGQRQLLYYSNHFLHICLDRGWQATTAPTRRTVGKPLGAIPFSGAATPAVGATRVHLRLHVTPMMQLCRYLSLSTAHTGNARAVAPVDPPTSH